MAKSKQATFNKYDLNVEIIDGTGNYIDTSDYTEVIATDYEKAIAYVQQQVKLCWSKDTTIVLVSVVRTAECVTVVL